MDQSPKFLLDSMLGKLARWLVLLGYDASFAESGRSDLDLLEQAHREGRVFVTRDLKIPEVSGLRKVVVTSQRFDEQLSQVMKELDLKVDRARLFSRCTYCNEALVKLSREEALAEAPPKVRELPTDFYRCPDCRRLYWNGTHTDRAVKKLERLHL